MDKIVKNVYSGEKIIESKIPLLIELFTSYYGNFKRSDIESKFNNTIVHCPFSIESLEDYILNGVLYPFKLQIYNKVMSITKYGKDINSDDIISRYSTELISENLKSFYQFYNERTEASFKKCEAYLKKFDSTINITNYKEKVSNPIFRELETIYTILKQLETDYNLARLQFEPVLKLANASKESKINLITRLHREYVNDFRNLIPKDREKDRKNLKDYITCKTSNLTSFNKFFFGEPGNCYGSKFSEFLFVCNPKHGGNKKDGYKHCINYIKQLGIDFGDDFEDYQQHYDELIRILDAKGFMKLVENRDFYRAKEKNEMDDLEPNFYRDRKKWKVNI